LLVTSASRYLSNPVRLSDFIFSIAYVDDLMPVYT
jgi:hypothetical protein